MKKIIKIVVLILIIVFLFPKSFSTGGFVGKTTKCFGYSFEINIDKAPYPDKLFEYMCIGIPYN